MTLRAALPAILCAIALGGAATGCNRSIGRDAQANAVSSAAVSCVGLIAPAPRVLRIAGPGSQPDGVLAEMPVEEGDVVKAGQVLGVLDQKGQLEAARDFARSQVTVAEARLAQLRAGAKLGDLQAQQAEIERCAAAVAMEKRAIERQETLFSKKLVSALEIDDSRLKLQTQERMLENAQEKLRSLSEVRDVDVVLRTAEVEAAQARARQAETGLQRVFIRAPVDGTILRINTRPGEQIGAHGLLEMGNLEQMLVIAEVYETDLLRLREGQRAEVGGGPLPAKLGGVVSYVSRLVGRNEVLQTDPAAVADARVAEVKIRLDKPAEAAFAVRAKVEVTIFPEEAKRQEH